ncbi:MAG: hypothetical protein QM820_00200 [Minicystis sp.]
MRLPSPTAHYGHCVRVGNYAGRRCRRAQLGTLAADAYDVTAALLAAGRAYEDADKPIQDALADRDAFDDDLDGTAQDARAALAGRSADAVKNEPYTRIFPEGIAYYTAAPIDQEAKRYGELKQRLTTYLPAGDEVIAKAVPAIDQGLDGFAKATAALTQARTDEALAGTRLAAAREAWAKQMEKTYGALVAAVGKAKAESFFPRVKGTKDDAAEKKPTPEKKPTADKKPA